MELLSIDRAEFCPFCPAAIFLHRQKSSPFHRSPGRRGSKSLFRRSGTQSAVLSEVLNGTDHLRGVGVLVVVPRHDLNLIGVVVATLNFHDFFVIVHNFETTVTVPQCTVVVLNPACSYHYYTTFQRYFQVFLISFSDGIFMRAIAHILIRHPSESPGPGASAGASALPRYSPQSVILRL